MTILRSSAKLIAALSLTSLITIGSAMAQTPEARQSAAVQKATEQKAAEQKATHQQSTNQIVGATQEKTSQQQTATQQQKPAAPQANAAEEQLAVVPPAPAVIKRSPNTISVPGDAAEQEPRYEESAVVSSNVRVGSMFGYRRDPFTRRARFHAGVDIKARWGDPVGASQKGVVQFAGWYYGYGNMVIVNHGGGIATHYAHLSSFDVAVGDKVERSTIVGRAGSTGRATSPHLHYEVRIDGNAVNPFQVIALDPSSEYFKQTQPQKDAADAAQTAEREQAEQASRPRRVN